MSTVSLATLRKGARNVVVNVRDDTQSLGDETDSTVSRRLLELGFVEGEAVEVIEEVWPGGDPMVVRLGGSAADLTLCWAQRERHALDEVRGWAAELGAALEADGRWRGLAVTTDAIIRGYGLTGPAARAAGHDLDLRRTGLPDDLAGLLDVPTESAGDAHTRFAVLVSLRNGYGFEPWPIVGALVALALPPLFANTYTAVRGAANR